MNVAVLGNGQLGAMLRQAGAGLGIKVKLLNIEADLYPANDVLLTVEREHWPANPYTEALRQHPNWLNQTALHTLANRARQKTLLDELGIATAPWLAPDTRSDQNALHARLGPDIFLKRTEGGYDGRGQQRLLQAQPAALPAWITEAIAEQAMPFERELSIIGARSRSGQTSFYELTENHHEQGILMISIHQSGRYQALQTQAQTMLANVMTALDYVGVMAMELFLVGDQLIVNEIAPRVHNSGHWTQAGAAIDQFELHLRAVCDLPLPVPAPRQTGTCVMLNLIGMEFDPSWLSSGAAQCHWYGKHCQPGRKMGHLNFYQPEAAGLMDVLEQTIEHTVRQLTFPASYQSSIAWARAILTTPDTTPR